MIINPVIPIWLMAIFCIGIIAIVRKDVKSYIRQILIAILLFVINLRIMTPNGEFETSKVETNTYVLFVVDNTISMYADDARGDGVTRREAILSDASYIMDELPGAHYAVISFDNNARMMTPYTDNTSFCKSIIETMSPLPYFYANGTGLNTPHDVMAEKLKNLSEDLDGAQKIVFFMTDGEITNDEKLMSYDDLASYIDGGAVLGYGTTTGAKMVAPVSYYDPDETVTIHDEHYNDAISVMDEKNLKALAKDMKVDYIYMTSEDQVDGILEDIRVEQENIGTISKTMEGYDDTYYYVAIPLVLLLAWEILSFGLSRNHKKNKQGVKADAPQA